MLDVDINILVWIHFYHFLEDIEVSFYNMINNKSEYPDINKRGIKSFLSLKRYSSVEDYISHIRDDLDFLRTNS